MTTTDDASPPLGTDMSVRLRIVGVQIPDTANIDGTGSEAVEFLEWAGFRITDQNGICVRARPKTEGVSLLFRSGIFLEYRRPNPKDVAVFFEIAHRSDGERRTIDEGYFVPRWSGTTNRGPICFQCDGYTRMWKITCEEPLESQLLPPFSPLAGGQMTLDEQMAILRRAGKKAEKKVTSDILQAGSSTTSTTILTVTPAVQDLQVNEEVNGKCRTVRKKQSTDLKPLNFDALFDRHTPQQK